MTRKEADVSPLSRTQHAVVEGSNYVDEFLWAADLHPDLPKSFPVHRVQGLGKVYEDHVKVLKLLTALFLYLSGRKDHVRSTAATLTLG